MNEYDNGIRARICFFNQKRPLLKKKFWDGVHLAGEMDVTIVVTRWKLQDLFFEESLEERLNSVNNPQQLMKELANDESFFDPEMGRTIKVEFDRDDPSRFTLDVVETLARIQEEYDGREFITVMDISIATQEQAFHAYLLTAMMDTTVIFNNGRKTTQLRSMPRIIYLGDTQTDLLMKARNRSGFSVKDVAGKGDPGFPAVVDSESAGRSIVRNLSAYEFLKAKPIENRKRGRNSNGFTVTYEGRVMGLINTRIVDGSRYWESGDKNDEQSKKDVKEDSE